MSKYALTLSFFVYSYSVHMLKRALSSFGNLVVRKRIFFISVFINLAWFCPVATSCIAFWNHWQFWRKFPLSCLWVYFSSSLKENLFLIPKILYFDPIATSIFGCSLDLSKLNWIKINTVTNSSQIVSKISFLSWVASLRLLFFELKHLKRKLWRATQETGLSICWHEYPWTLEILPVCVVQSYIACISKS